jgi:hypothetical protein
VRLAATMVILLLVAACGAAVPAPTANSSATAAAAPSVTPMPAPAGWTYVPWYDPDLEIALPTGWVPNIKFETLPPDPSASPDEAAGAAWWNSKVAKGAMRLQASSDTSRALLVLAESGDASLEAFVARYVGDSPFLKEVARHDAQFAAGRSIVVDYATQASSYAGLVRDYYFRLADGRSLLVEVSDIGLVGASPAPDATALGTLGDQIVATLRPHQ